MGEIVKMGNEPEVKMIGRTVYDVMQKVVAGRIKRDVLGGLVDNLGNSITMKGEPFWAFRSMNMRCVTIKEAEVLCKSMVKPGMEGDFVILPIYVVKSDADWKKLEEKYNLKREDESGN